MRVTGSVRPVLSARSARLVAFAAAFLLVLSGCKARADVNVTVQPNGSGSVVVTAVLDADATAQLGVTRGDFGNISIRDDFSLVELPDDLDAETLASLRHTRIGKNPIDIRRDQGPPRARGGAKRAGQGARGYGRDGGRRGEQWGKRGNPKVAGRPRG